MQKLTAQDEVRRLLTTPKSMRNPAWRYVIAQHAVADPTSDLSTLGNDRWLLECSQFYRESRLQGVSRKRRMPKLREGLWDAYCIYTTGTIRSQRWALEAAILTGDLDDKIADKLKITPQAVQAYRYMFYDVELFLGDTDALYINVLPMSYNRLNEGMVWDIGWKLAAIDFGWDGLMMAIRGGYTQEQQDRLFQRQFTNSMMSADLLLMNKTQGFNEQMLSVLNTANKYWDLSVNSKNLAKSTRQLAVDSFFNALAPIVEGSIKTAQPTQETIEKLLL